MYAVCSIFAQPPQSPLQLGNVRAPAGDRSRTATLRSIGARAATPRVDLVAVLCGGRGGLQLDDIAALAGL
jgi:hypothetical protein